MKYTIMLLFLAVVAAHGQVIGDTLTIQSQSPTGAQGISAGAVGAAGTTNLYYFVATRYPSGLVLPGLPVLAANTVGIANLTGVNLVQIGWTAAPGATGYYVIRGTTQSFLASGACTACVVVANTATIGFSDVGGATTNWPPAGVPTAASARFDMILDNYSEASPYLRTVLSGIAGRLPTLDSGTAPTSGNCAEWAANGTLSDTTGPCAVTAAALTAGSVVFADATGELGQDNANFFWDDANNRLGLLIAATPLAPVHLNGQLLINGAAALDADVTAVTGAARLATVQDNSAVSVVGSVANAANAVGVELYALKTRAAAPASDANTIVVDADGVLDISGYGADGVDYQPLARVLMSVDGTPGAGDMPGRITLSTTLDGAAALTERVRIANDGTASFNSTPPDADVSTVGLVERAVLIGDNNLGANLVSVANAANVNGALFLGMKTRAAAPASDANTIVVDGDNILELTGYGADGAAYQLAAQILFEVDGTPGVGDMPGRIVFSTTLDGAAVLTERMRIPDTGGLQMAAVAFASLPAAADGTMVYCSDCDAAAAGAGPTVCASTPGTGTFAFRLNGAWTCLGI